MIAGLEEPDKGRSSARTGSHYVSSAESGVSGGAKVLDYVADGKWEQDWNTEE